MKKISLTILSALLISFSACTPEELPGLPEPIVQAEEVVGNWKLMKVEQMDESPMGDHQEMYDITAAFPFQEMEVQFKQDGSFVALPGEAPMLFQAGDEYTFLDEDMEPAEKNLHFIQLGSGDILTLNSSAFSRGELSVSIEGSCESSASYTLVFSKM